MEKRKCKECGRNSDCFKGLCSYCSRLDFAYSQGAITLKTYNLYMDDWKSRSLKRETKNVLKNKVDMRVVGNL